MLIFWRFFHRREKFNLIKHLYLCSKAMKIRMVFGKHKTQFSKSNTVKQIPDSAGPIGHPLSAVWPVVAGADSWSPGCVGTQGMTMSQCADDPALTSPAQWQLDSGLWPVWREPQAPGAGHGGVRTPGLRGHQAGAQVRSIVHSLYLKSILLLPQKCNPPLCLKSLYHCLPS